MKQLFPQLLLIAAFFIATSCSSEKNDEPDGPSSFSGDSSSSVGSDSGISSSVPSSSSANNPGDSSSSTLDDSSSSAEPESSPSALSSSSVDDDSSSSARSSSSVGTSSSSSARSSSSSRPSSSSVAASSSSSAPSSSSGGGSSSSVAGGGTSSSSGGSTTACTPSARTWNDVSYGTRANTNVVDIKVPSSGNGPWPLIIFVHGGAWQGQAGSENSVTAPFNNAITKGYALASVRYSYIGRGKAFPESVEDVVAAVRFLRAKAADYCINPDKIGITGFSSGGYFTHIVAALSGVSGHSFDKESLNLSGVSASVSSKVQAAASCAGLSDFLLLNDHVSQSGVSGMNHCGTGSPNGSYFGFDPCTATGANKETVDSSNPIKYIKAGNCADLPPVLSMHGTADNIVPWPQSKLMADELNAKCGAGKGTYYQHSGGHGCPSGYDNQIWAFLDAALK